MKKIQKVVFMILILATVSSAAFAAIIYPELKFVGFSADGKYLAFEESGEARGAYKDSYYDYAATYYVDVAKNSFALPPTFMEMPEGKMGGIYLIRRASNYKKQVALKLKKLGIESGNTGDFVVAHFLNDWSFVKRSEGESYFLEKGGKNLAPKIMPNYPGGYGKVNTTEIEKIIFNHILDSYQKTDAFFELTLIPTLLKPREGCPESYKVELTLKNNSLHRETELQILQKDGDILPENRYCSLGYKIERVYLYKDRIAVFLNVFSQEFPNLSKELPNIEIDMNYLVVTGLISDK